MDGPRHYEAAEKLISSIDGALSIPAILALAQVHATLALAAATGVDGAVDRVRWMDVAS